MNSITLERFRHFQETARHQSIAVASRTLRLSPSAIFHSIKTLETEYGVPLFDRVGKRIVLNARGQRLLDEVGQVFAKLDGIPTALQGTSPGFTGYLGLGGSFFLAETALPAIVRELSAAHPDLRATVAPLRSATIADEIARGRLDYAVGFSLHSRPGLYQVALADGVMKIVLSRTHPELSKLRRAAAKSFGFLNDLPALLHQDSSRVDHCENHPAFDRIGVRPRVGGYFESDGIAVETLRGSCFWAVVPDCVAEKFKADLWVVPTPTTFRIGYAITSLRLLSKRDLPLFQALDQMLEKRLKL